MPGFPGGPCGDREECGGGAVPGVPQQALPLLYPAVWMRCEMGMATTFSPSLSPLCHLAVGGPRSSPTGTHHSGKASRTRLPWAARGALGAERGVSAGNSAPWFGNMAP